MGSNLGHGTPPPVTVDDMNCAWVLVAELSDHPNQLRQRPDHHLAEAARALNRILTQFTRAGQILNIVD